MNRKPVETTSQTETVLSHAALQDLEVRLLHLLAIVRKVAALAAESDPLPTTTQPKCCDGAGSLAAVLSTYE